MRRKAELEIRQAAVTLKNTDCYRIDRVRERTALIRKVFDKTILDMARVGTISLESRNISEMNEAEIGNFIRQGDTVYISFNFLDGGGIPEDLKPKTLDVTLQGFDLTEWARFEYLCKTREEKTAVEKIREMIRDYNRQAAPGQHR